MKRTCLYFFILLFVSGFYMPSAKANRAGGGELIYEWISDSTYRFFFKYYNNCASDSADTAQTLCMHNTCLDSVYTLQLEKWSGAQPGGGTQQGILGAPCATKTTCDSPGSNIPGYKQYWYSKVLKLPARCSLWRFSVAVASRSANNNLDPVTNKNNIYVEITLNNVIAQGNSSPYFTINPVPYVCADNPYVYNNGAIDPNGDSIVTEIIRPRTHSGNCEDTAEIIPFAAATPPYSVPANPFQTNNSLTVNSKTGQIAFIAATPGAGAIAIRVREYRNGQFIGSVTRDVQLQVIACSTDLPQLRIDANSVTGGYTADSSVYGCTGQPLSFCWDIKGNDAISVFITSDNHVLIPAMQTATVTYTHNKKDSVRGCISWTPKQTDAGSFGFVVAVKDSTCRPPGIMLYYARALPIRIWGQVSTVKDTLICLGESAKLYAKGSSGYTWSVLSGSMGSIVCPSCDTTLVTPTIPTVYRVVSAAGSFCGFKIDDTVAVNVKQPVFSSVYINASDTNITEGDNVIVNTVGVNCLHPAFQWQINGNDISGADSSKFVYNAFNNLDTVTCKVTCPDTCATPLVAISNSIVIHVKPAPVSVSGAVGQTDFNIYPNPTDGNFTLKGKMQTGTVKVHILDMTGRTLHTEKIIVEPGMRVNKQFEMKSLPGGTYLFRIISDTGTQTFRLQVQH